MHSMPRRANNLLPTDPARSTRAQMAIKNCCIHYNTQLRIWLRAASAVCDRVTNPTARRGSKHAPASQFALYKISVRPVHFYRNVFSHVPAAKVCDMSHPIKAIHAQESREAADRKARAVVPNLRAANGEKPPVSSSGPFTRRSHTMSFPTSTGSRSAPTITWSGS